MNEIVKNGFFEAVESLKKYRRAELIDEKGRNLLDKLYTDLLPNDHILKKCLLPNTTFLIGRKGTGKSTIFLRLEQELRKNNNFISCYLDVNTIFDSAQSQYSKLDYVSDLIPDDLINKYLIQRNFVQSVLIELQKEVASKTDSFFQKMASKVLKTKPDVVREGLDELKLNIQNNDILKEIEIPVLRKINFRKNTSNEVESQKNKKLGGDEINFTGGPTQVGIGFKSGSESSQSVKDKNFIEVENEFSNVFLQVFQIKEIILKIKNILQQINVKHLVILLDDFSEVDDESIKIFVDVLLAPLNNWSEEFIKFKIAAYPNRIYYGRIDPGKIDTIQLDFYNLYSEFDRDKMEERAIDFTKRLLTTRLNHFTNEMPQDFFETSNSEIEEYYELLFQVSMNVPRILGYILSFCYQSKIIFDKKINKTDIEAAAQKYYTEKLLPFFNKTTYSLLSIDEKISTLQLKELLDTFVNKLLDNKKRISTSELKGASYLPSFPFSSHFYFDPRYEEFLKTLELNFFISKYNDMSDKDGNEASIFSINYGCAIKNNLLWGKPKGNRFRKYFVERPFGFNKLLFDFFSQAKKIHCINPECNKQFTIEELKFLEFNNNKCNKCQSPVVIESISNEIQVKLEKIDSKKLLPNVELNVLIELLKSSEALFARDIAEELDYSRQLIAWRSRKLDNDYNYVERFKEEESLPYKYRLTKKGKEYFD